MKKLLALLLTLAMLLSSAAIAEYDYTGKWVLAGAKKVGTEEIMDASEFGLSGSLVLNEDGTYVLESGGEEETGTWEATETGIGTNNGEYWLGHTLVGNSLVSNYTFRSGKDRR